MLIIPQFKRIRLDPIYRNLKIIISVQAKISEDRKECSSVSIVKPESTKLNITIILARIKIRGSFLLLPSI